VKIAIASTLRPYNEARLFDRQALLWAEHGNDVHIFARDFGEALEPLPSNLSVTRLRSTLSGWPRRLHLGWQAVRAISALKPDVVHYHDPELHFWLPWLARRGTKIVYDVRENHPFLIEHFNRFKVRHLSVFFAKLFWRVEATALRHGFLVSVTRRVADIYRPLRRPTVTVMNFASRRRFAQHRPSRDPVMICGGTLNQDRGLTEMVQLVSAVRRRVPEVRLLLCGSFASLKLKSEVLSYARHCGVESSIDLLERVSHREYITSVLPRARLGISITPPNAQNDCAFPIRLGEYWAVGLPSVTNDLPEVKAIHDADSFFDMVRYGNMDELRSTVEKYLLDYDAASEAGDLARRRFEDIYNGETEFDRLRGFYQVTVGLSC